MEDYRDRNHLWQTQSLQDQLAHVHVVIGGMGGLGWLIGTALIGLGVRHLQLFDPDRLAKVNFNRLWGCRSDQVGQPKVDIFAETAHGIDREIEIKVHTQAIPSIEFEKALSRADVVFGGFDLPEPRLATQILALKSDTLYIDVGVAIQATAEGFDGFGQIFVSKNSQSGCIVCAGLRLDNIGYRGEGRGPLPSSGVLNGVLANLAVSIWMKYLLGEPVAPLTLFNWNQLSLQTAEIIHRHPQCPICGPTPAWEKLLEASYAES